RSCRVVRTGEQPGKPVPSRPDKDVDLKKLSLEELSELTHTRNSWQRRQAGRLLAEQLNPNLKADHSGTARLGWSARDCCNNDPHIRAAAAASIRQFTSGSLTVDSPPTVTVSTSKLLPMFQDLLARPSLELDFYYPHIVWMAMEPRVAAEPETFFPIVSANENSV